MLNQEDGPKLNYKFGVQTCIAYICKTVNSGLYLVTYQRVTCISIITQSVGKSHRWVETSCMLPCILYSLQPYM